MKRSLAPVLVRIGLGAVVLCVVLALGGWLARPVPATVVEAVSAPVRKTVVASGRVSSAVQVQVGALVSGRVAATPVDAGAVVKKRQLLLQLERAAELAALAQAESALDQARLQLDEALRQYRRQQEMFRAKVISAAQFETEKNKLDLAHNQVQGSRAAVDAARARLDETAILAPDDGIVLRRDIEVGDLVQPGSPVLALAVSGPVWVRVDADERYLAALALRQQAQVIADAYPGRPFSAIVIEIAPVIDRQRGTVEVKLAVPEAPDFLLNDMTVSAEIDVAAVAAAVVVPNAALHESNGGAWVWLAADGRVQRRAVTVGLRGDAGVQIAQGLAVGERVVIEPATLREGQRVRVE